MGSEATKATLSSRPWIWGGEDREIHQAGPRRGPVQGVREGKAQDMGARIGRDPSLEPTEGREKQKVDRRRSKARPGQRGLATPPSHLHLFTHLGQLSRQAPVLLAETSTCTFSGVELAPARQMEQGRAAHVRSFLPGLLFRKVPPPATREVSSGQAGRPGFLEQSESPVNFKNPKSQAPGPTSETLRLGPSF